MGAVLEISEEARARLMDTEISVVQDDFEDKRYIEFTRIAGKSWTKYFRTYSKMVSYSINSSLGITFKAINEKVFIEFDNQLQGFSFGVGDELIFLFNGGTRLAYKVNSSLTLKDVTIFATKGLDKWKLNRNSKGDYIVGELDFQPVNHEYINPQHNNLEEARFLLQFIASVFLKAYFTEYPQTTIEI